MAPEQAWGRTNLIDARTDVYALGGLLYAILTGHAPHQGSSQSDTLELARKGVVRDPAAVCPGVPIAPSLCAIAMKALAKNAADRTPSAEALKLEVERALREGLWFGSRVFAAGTVILREGDPGDAAYIVTKGRCEVTRRVGGASGEQVRLREMGPGEAFGELALVSDRPRSATVTAIDEVTAMVITREALARELQAGSWMGVLVRTLVERFQDVEERAISRTR
jgi:hypothetical protein